MATATVRLPVTHLDTGRFAPAAGARSLRGSTGTSHSPWCRASSRRRRIEVYPQPAIPYSPEGGERILRMLLPKIVQVETVATACTARCVMCPIESWTRPVGTMKLDFFAQILDRLKPHVRSIEHTVLQGCGEPLLDKTIAQKVALARRNGFRGVHFSTNGTELTENAGRDLLEAGIHLVTFSIDGITGQTHESIRRLTDYDKIVEHTHRFIGMRNASGYGTRIWIRPQVRRIVWRAR